MLACAVYVPVAVGLSPPFTHVQRSSLRPASDTESPYVIASFAFGDSTLILFDFVIANVFLLSVSV